MGSASALPLATSRPPPARGEPHFRPGQPALPCSTASGSSRLFCSPPGGILQRRILASSPAAWREQGSALSWPDTGPDTPEEPQGRVCGLLPAPPGWLCFCGALGLPVTYRWPGAPGRRGPSTDRRRGLRSQWWAGRCQADAPAWTAEEESRHSCWGRGTRTLSCPAPPCSEPPEITHPRLQQRV